MLVLAMGAGRKAIPGVEHTKTIWGTPDDAERVGQHLQSLIDKGNGRMAIGFGGNPADPSAIRGGPAFEVMFNIIHKLKRLGLRDRFDLTFFAPMPNPGARLGERAAAAVQAQLRAEGVNLRHRASAPGFGGLWENCCHDRLPLCRHIGEASRFTH